MSNFISGDNNRIEKNVTNLHAIGCNDQVFDESHSDSVRIKGDALVIKDTEIVSNVPTSLPLMERASNESGNFTVVQSKDVYFVDTTLGDVDCKLDNIGIEITIIKISVANKVTFSSTGSSIIEVSDLLAKKDKVIIHYDAVNDTYWGLQ
jgi:hypothetical protein